MKTFTGMVALVVLFLLCAVSLAGDLCLDLSGSAPLKTYAGPEITIYASAPDVDIEIVDLDPMREIKSKIEAQLASTTQMKKQNTSGWGASSRTTVSVFSSNVAAAAPLCSMGAQRAAPVRRIFGRLFRGRAAGCSY
jgi:hypothetical protein